VVGGGVERDQLRDLQLHRRGAAARSWCACS
jgi:hypothetical protein